MEPEDARQGTGDPSPGRIAAITNQDVPLPSPRQLISVGLELCYRATSRIRTVSIAIGLQLLGCIGPFVLLLLIVLTRAPGLVDAAVDGTPIPADAIPPGVGLGLIVGLLVGGLGFLALSIESEVLAVGILGGQAVDRPMTSHEALRRSRQVFWSVVVGMIVSTIPGTIASTALTALLPVGAAASELVFVIQAIVTTIFLVPFVYTTSGIVLGGVDVVEALKRSFGMARIRWRLAFVAALARTLAQTLLAFGLSAGLDILSRGASGLGLGLDGGAVQTFVTIIVVAMGVVAFGSLLATIAAISVAPEVVAFVGLTHYAGGLDGARDGATGAPPPPWVSRPMLVGIATALFFSLIGASAAASIAAF